MQTPRYPANPAADVQGVFLSADGVYAYRGPRLALAWQALPGTSPLEPVPAETRLLVGSGHGLYALDKRTGRVAWRRWPGRRVFSPTVVGAIAYVGDAAGELHALALPDGEELWRVALPGWVYPPAILGGTLFTGGSDGTVWALDAATGARRWSRPLGQELVYRPVAVAGDTVVATTFGAEVIALAAADGRVRWRRRLASSAMSPLPAAATLVVPTLGGELHGLDPESGRTRWCRRLAGPLRDAPVLDGERIAVRDETGRVTLLASADGHVAWSRQASHAAVGSPWPAGETVWQFVAEGRKEPTPHPVDSRTDPPGRAKELSDDPNEDPDRRCRPVRR